MHFYYQKYRIFLFERLFLVSPVSTCFVRVAFIFFPDMDGVREGIFRFGGWKWGLLERVRGLNVYGILFCYIFSFVRKKNQKRNLSTETFLVTDLRSMLLLINSRRKDSQLFRLFSENSFFC